MKYMPRPGIVTTNICSVMVLIPSRAVSGECDTVRSLPMLWAATWEQLRKGAPDADATILRIHQILTGKPDEEIRAGVREFCEEMCRAGFLIRVPEDESEEGPA